MCSPCRCSGQTDVANVQLRPLSGQLGSYTVLNARGCCASGGCSGQSLWKWKPRSALVQIQITDPKLFITRF